MGPPARQLVEQKSHRGVGRSQTKGQYQNMGTWEGDGLGAANSSAMFGGRGGVGVLSPSLCNDAARKLRERFPVKPALTPPHCFPGCIFHTSCILLECAFSTGRELRPRQALATHPTSFKGKAASKPEGTV